jgi:hypothetical protein
MHISTVNLIWFDIFLKVVQFLLKTNKNHILMGNILK